MTPKKRNNKAYSYIRFSSTKQAKGTSLQRQKKASYDYCKQNGLELQSLTLQDLGVSAFSGKNAISGSLGTFLKAVEEGQVEQGSTLIVESLDRLTRAELTKSQPLILGILTSGIDIVTLNPERRYSQEGANTLGAAIEILVILSRANEESEIKSARGKAAWRIKKDRIKDGYKTSGKCPSWMFLNDDKKSFTLIPEKVAVVQQIYQWAADGCGSIVILRKLHENKIQPIGYNSRQWNKSFVVKLLKNRTVLGELQLQKKVDGKYINDGDPVEGYYPAIISEELFYQVQAGMEKRKYKGSTGKTSGGINNLFTGIVYDARDHHVMRYAPKKDIDSLVSGGAIRGELDSVYLSIPYHHFEKTILNMIKGLSLDNIQNRPKGKKDTGIIENKIQATNGKIETLKQRINNSEGDTFTSLLDILENLEIEKKELQQKLETIKIQNTSNTKSSISNAFKIMKMMELAENIIKEAPKKQAEEQKQRFSDFRLKLKTIIRDIVEKIWILPYKIKGTGKRVYYCQMIYSDGKTERFIINYNPFSQDHSSKFICKAVDTKWNLNDKKGCESEIEDREARVLGKI